VSAPDNGWETMTEGVFSVLLGGALAIIGGLISQGISWLTLQKQLKHDAIEKNKERQYQSKKDAYLDLIAAYARFVSDITNLSNREMNALSLSSIQEPLTIAVAKAQLVSDPNTSLLLDDFVIEMQKLIQTVAPALMSVYSATLDLKNSVDLYEAQSREQGLTLEEMKKLRSNSDEISAYHRMSVLSDRFETARQSMEKLMTERTSLIQAEKNAKLNYAHVTFSSITDMNGPVLAAHRALREELGYPLSDADIETKMKKNASSKEALGQFLGEFEHQLDRY
jgi:hypothetical protein